MPFTTAWTGLVDIAKLAAKDTVLITAASSSVGLAAIQVARREGAIPIALTRRSRKADALLQAGAAHVIATEEKDVEEEIRRFTDGKGARVVFDAVGGPSFAKLVSSTSMDGLVLTYGVLSKEMNSFPAIQVLRRRLTIRGFAANSTLDDDAASTLSKATSFRDSRPVHSSAKSPRRFPSKASSTLTAISSRTSSSGKSLSPFSVGSSDEEMHM